MLTLRHILRSLLVERKEIDVSKLPSQGLFYPEDFKLKIKKAEINDIFEYEQRIDRNDLLKTIDCIKEVVNKNISLNKKYTFYDLKSVDVIFVFLEIVKFTKEKDLMINYVDAVGEIRKVAFGPDNFSYFDFGPFMKYYDEQRRELLIDGFRFSFPSIGIENSLSRYLMNVVDPIKLDALQKISFEFLFFLTGKNTLTDEEIDNLIQIFNYDLDDDVKQKIKNMIAKFSPILSYSLQVDGKKVEMRSSMNLQTIWQD